jgi:hypothetical protein
LKRCLKQIAPFLNRNDDRESFSFQRAKKTPTGLPVTTGFSVGAASNLRKLLQPVNRFFVLFFSEQFLIQIPLALQLVWFRTRRVIIRTSVCYATRFLNYFLKNNFSFKSHSLCSSSDFEQGG